MMYFCKVAFCQQRWTCTLSPLPSTSFDSVRKLVMHKLQMENFWGVGKKHAQIFLYSESWTSHSHPTSSSVNCCKGKPKTLLHSRLNCNSIFFLPTISYLSLFLGGIIEKSCPSKPWQLPLLPWFWHLALMDIWEEFCSFVLYRWTGKLLEKLEHMLFKTEGCVVSAGLLQSSATQARATCNRILRLAVLTRLKKSVQLWLERRGGMLCVGCKWCP